MGEGDLYERIIGSVDDVYGGARKRTRALHAKGSWARGTFTASARAAELSRAQHLQGEPIEALVRFSNASGDPLAADYERDGRGMGVKLRWEGGENDILSTTSPTFVTRTPEDFLELMELRRPDPETGEPDMAKLGAFLGAHPEAGPAAEAVLMREPLASFATAAYFSPHAFALVDAAGNRTWVKYRWHPLAGEQRLPDDDARERGRDYLHADLAERLRAGPVVFDLQLQVAAPEDPLDDATSVWPSQRELIPGGRLELTESVADPEADGHIDVFDPTRVTDGIELSDDPILHARPRAYSVSAYRRLE
jgi:catalase